MFFKLIHVQRPTLITGCIVGALALFTSNAKADIAIGFPSFAAREDLSWEFLLPPNSVDINSPVGVNASIANIGTSDAAIPMLWGWGANFENAVGAWGPFLESPNRLTRPYFFDIPSLTGIRDALPEIIPAGGSSTFSIGTLIPLSDALSDYDPAVDASVEAGKTYTIEEFNFTFRDEESEDQPSTFTIPSSNTFEFTTNQTPPGETPTDNVVHLDFGGTSIGLKVLDSPWFRTPTWELVADGYSPSSFDADARQKLQNDVQTILDRSGVNVTLTQERPKDGDFVTVEITDETVTYGPLGASSINGIAWDVMPNATVCKNISDQNCTDAIPLDAFGVDRFNERKDGKVALFGTGGGLFGQEAARIIVHELGHAWGTVHIEDQTGLFPLRGTKGVNESGVPINPVGWKFWDEIATTEDDDSRTHNPQWHVRRYVNGEAPENIKQLDGDGKSTTGAGVLRPGSWDTNERSRDLGYFSLNFGPIMDNYGELFLGLANPGFIDADDDITLLFDVTDRLSSESELILELWDETEFSLFGRSRGAKFIDTVMMGKNSFDMEFSLDSLGSEPLGLFRRDGRSGETFLEREVAVRALAPIPLSPSFAFSLLGFGSFVLIGIHRRRRAYVFSMAEGKGDHPGWNT